MAKLRRKKQVDYGFQSYQLTHSLLRAKTQQELIDTINEQTQRLSREEECMVLARTIGNQLALISELRALPHGERTTDAFLQRLSDLIVTTEIEAVSGNVSSN